MENKIYRRVKKQMKRNIWKSFQVEIIFSCFLSILLTILTLGTVGGGCYLLYSLNKNVAADERNHVEFEAENDYSGLPENDEAGNGKMPPESKYGMVERGAKPLYIVSVVLLIVLGVLLFIFYFLLLTQKYARDLKKISQCIYQVTEGVYETRIDIPGDDEFANIAAGLNQMIEKIDYVIQSERQNEMAKNTLITNVAHDLRTPLTSIIGYLQLASDEERCEESDRKKYIGIAYQKSKRLEGMLEDLFSYTKYTFSDVALKLNPVDMVQFVNQMIEEFYPGMEEAGLKVDFYYQEASIMIEADGEKMARAIANLFSNAIKYGKNGKIIRIRLLQTEQLHFYMVNYGEIIPKEDLEHIFDRFYRVETSRSLDTGGTGLGLAITRRIIEMHHGTIEVTSGDEGTVFHIVLPLTQEEN